MSKVDICDRLRLAPANLIGTDDEERYWVCHDAVREIERLRLTSAERTIIQWAAAAMQPDCRATLRGLLERTK
jgi:hypothetical protein